MTTEREGQDEEPDRRQVVEDDAVERTVNLVTDEFRRHLREIVLRRISELQGRAARELPEPLVSGGSGEPKSQFQRVAEALVAKGNRPRTTSWIVKATGIPRSSLSQILHRTHKDSFISHAIPGYSRKKLWSLTEEAAKGVGQLVPPFTQPTLFGLEGDLSQMIAIDCCARILRDHGNEPMSPLTLAREAIARGYKGRVKGPAEAVLFVIAKSFWSALTRDERFEKAGAEMFQLKEAAGPLKPPGAKDDDQPMERAAERQGRSRKDEEE